MPLRAGRTCNVNYLTDAQVLSLHAQLIEETGSEQRVLNRKLLAAAVACPKATFYGKDIYVTLFDKAAALLEALVGQRPFVDGNKRVGIAATAYFLQGNGYQLIATQAELVQFTLQVAEGKFSRQEIADWLSAHSSRLESQRTAYTGERMRSSRMRATPPSRPSSTPRCEGTTLSAVRMGNRLWRLTAALMMGMMVSCARL